MEQKLAEAFEKGHAAEDDLRKLTNKGAEYPADGTDAARGVDRARRMMQAAAYQRDIAKGELPSAWEALRADVHKKLSSGILVGKGFRSPHAGGAPEITIPQDEWRILALDNVKSEVTTKRDGQVAYVGVLIAEPQAKIANDSKSSLVRADETFGFGQTIYYESRSIKAPDGRETKLYENRFYIVTSNASEDGRTLRNVQAEILGYETPVLAAIRGSTFDKIDIKHGQAAFFFLGRTVGTDYLGNFVGTTTYEYDRLKQYEHNIPSGHKPSFEVWSCDNVYRYGLADPPPPSGWKLTMLISAEDKKSRRVVLDVNPGNQIPVTYEKGEVSIEKK